MSCLQPTPPLLQVEQRPGSSVGPPGGPSLVWLRSAGWRRAFAGTASRGEEEDGCSSVQSELPGQGRSPPCPGTSGHPGRHRSAMTAHRRRHRRRCEVKEGFSPLLYLFKQTVVPGFADADVPHHQHLEDTPASPRGPHTPQIVNQASWLSVYLHSQSLAFPFTF